MEMRGKEKKLSKGQNIRSKKQSGQRERDGGLIESESDFIYLFIFGAGGATHCLGEKEINK